MFNKNLAGWDRIARVLIGGFAISLAFWGPHTQWGWLGAILVATAAVGHCPIYVMLGLRTCPPGQKSAR